VTAELGAGNRGTNYVLRRRIGRPSWRERLGLPDGETLVYEVPDRDESGFRALAELAGHGVALAAAAVAASADHVLEFFRRLRDEVAFYLGAVNLHARLAELGPVSFPEPEPRGSFALRAEALADAALLLRLGEPVVANDLEADGARLLVVTGANQGGKSTFLRSLGLSELLMAAGLPVPARTYRAAVARRVFSHFSREEDETLRRGKLDEELARMRAIVDRLRPGDVVLLNESFSSTNEREGSEIARGVVEALVDAGIRVVYVTHLIDLAEGLAAGRRPGTCFFRAERRPDGTRTFRIVPGEPEGSSYGVDVYRRVFGEEIEAAVEGEVEAAGPADGLAARRGARTD
jgi:DNA mismatch repair ATPase MutS